MLYVPASICGYIEKLELSVEQRKVLEIWETLMDKEKEAVEIYVRGMKLK